MHSSRTNSRRRRVVLDEAVQANATLVEPDVKASESKRPRTYSSGARRKYQLRTTDLIPKKKLTLAAIISTLLSVVIGIILLDQFCGQWLGIIGTRGVEALTMDAPSSVSTWFASFLMIATAVGCLQVYYLRRHRCDDYKAVYRWWLWLAAFLILASINCVTGLFDIALAAFSNAVISSQEMTVGWGWSIVKLGVLFLLAARFGYEFRHSKGTVVGTGISVAVFTIALMLPWFPEIETAAGDYYASSANLALVGKVGVLSTVLVYGRFIYLEAHGLIKISAANPIAASERKTKPRTQRKKAEPKAKATRKKSSATSAKREATNKRSAAKLDTKTTATTKSSKSTQTGAASSPSSKSASATHSSATSSSASTLNDESDFKNRSAKNTSSVGGDKNEAEYSSLHKNESRQSKRNRRKAASNIQERESIEISEAEMETLSKSERRRLKKLQRRQSRAA